MIGGADENETEAQPSTRTATPPSPPSPPIEPPSSPLQGPGLGKRLLGSIRALALPASPPAAAASKVGLGLLLHLRPDHPSLHPATPSDSPSPSASDDPLEEDAAAARPHDAAGPPSPLNRYRIADAAATSAPISTMFRQWAAKRAPNLLQHFRPAADTADDQDSGRVDGQEAGGFRAGDESRPNHVASPSEDESIATDVSSASEEDDPLEDAAERPHAADAEPLYPLNRYRLSDPAAKRAPANTMFRQWVSKPAADTAVEEDREDESDESRATHFSSASEEEDGDRLDATEGLHAAHGDDGADLALDDYDDAVGGDQEEKVLQHCTGDQLRAARDDQEVVQQGAVHPRDETTCDTAAEGQEKVGSAENVDVGEGQELVAQDAIERKGEGTNGTTAEDQNKAMKQCNTYGLGTTENGDANDDLVEQCVIDKESAAMDDNAVKDHKVVGPTVVDGMCATIDDISAEDQEKKVEQCKTYGLGTTANGDAEDNGEVVEQCTIDKEHAAMDDNAVKDHEVVGPNFVDRMCATIDDISDEDQYKAVEQCNSNGLGTTENGDAKDDQEAVEQCVIDKERAALDDNAVKNHEVVGPTIVDGKCATIDDISAKDQEKKVEQCAAYDLETIGNDDAMEHQEVVEQGVGYREGLTIDHDDSIEDHEVVEKSIIEGMPASTDDIAVEDQMKVVEQCAVHEPGATKNEYTVKEKEKVVDQGIVYGEGLTIDHDDSVKDDKFIEGMPASTDDIVVEDQMKVVEQCEVEEPGATNDEYTVEEKEKVVEQGVIDKQGATNINVPVKDQDKLMKQQIVDNQGTVSMDDIAVKDRDMAAAQYASDAIITYGDDDPVEEHNKVGNQGFIDENVRTKDDIDVEEHDYRKEQVIIDNWGTFSDATALEDNKKLCNSDEQIADKDRYVLPMKRSMLGQRTGSKQGATKSYFTVEKHKDVVERVFHEWGAPDDDLAMDTAASQSIREVSSSEVVSATANGSDRGIGKKEKVQLPIRYPQRPGKLNCPFYMSQGSCSYGFSCQFHHPPLKANTDGSWCPSEQGNHGVAEILELNRIGLPIREGARNCTYYMRNGACRYGKHCHFNHPEHVIDAQFYAPTGWEDNALQVEKSSDHTTLDGTSYSKKSSDHATLDDTSYSKKSSGHATLDDTSSSSEVLPPNILRMLLPPQKVLPSTERKVMKVKKDSNWSSTSDDSDGCCSADSSDGPLCKQEHVDSSDGPLCKQEHVDYPERPGRPECPFYMRFGDCKFASACKYHHSKDKYPTRYHPEVPPLRGEQTEYPERPGEPECPFYMKKQFCKFGAQCRFNHPKDSNFAVQGPTNAEKYVATNEHQSTRITLEDHMPQQQQYPERPGQPDCRYYLQFGECKFLSACIFHHPRDGLPVGSNPSGPAHSDQIGPGTHDMPECPFYMKTGKCKFGLACEFRHPKDICSTTKGAFGHRTDLAYDNFTRAENAVQKQEQTMYPERPGEPQCFNYMRHGSCRFQMNCKYHHPADRLSRKQYDSTYH